MIYILKDTRRGKLGVTAQYWIGYIDLVELFLLLSRSCRTNDVDLFKFCIGEMCSIFFAAGRYNYSRWMVKYHLNLMNIDNTHPDLKQTLEKGCLTVKRISKSFSRYQWIKHWNKL